ncbi:hypothetical protein PIB30_111410, partial [Stylosanthes scabra]|nr:hypothetical protein [Stylosanthes scabra]
RCEVLSPQLDWLIRLARTHLPPSTRDTNVSDNLIKSLILHLPSLEVCLSSRSEVTNSQSVSDVGSREVYKNTPHITLIRIVFSTCNFFFGSDSICIELLNEHLAYLGSRLAEPSLAPYGYFFLYFRIFIFLQLKACIWCH